MKTALGFVLGLAMFCVLNIFYQEAYADTIENQLNDIQNTQQETENAISRAHTSDHLQNQIDRLNNAGN